MVTQWSHADQMITPAFLIWCKWIFLAWDQISSESIHILSHRLSLTVRGVRWLWRDSDNDEDIADECETSG